MNWLAVLSKLLLIFKNDHDGCQNDIPNPRFSFLISHITVKHKKPCVLFWPIHRNTIWHQGFVGKFAIWTQKALPLCC